MTWVYIIAMPVLLGLAFAGFALGADALCRRFAPTVAASPWFPIFVTGAFAAILLTLLPVYEAWAAR